MLNQLITKKSDEILKWALICNVVLVVLTVFASFTWPFAWDHGIFAWIGDVINRGGMPYRDAWDMKGPLAYYVYAFSQWIFGHNMWGIRIIDCIFLLISTNSLFLLIRSLTNTVTARWASVLYVLWFLSGNYTHTAQPDGWVGFIVIIIVSSIVNTKEQISCFHLIVLAMLISLSTLVKPIYAVFIVLLIIHILWYRKSDPQNRFYLLIPILVSAFCIPVAIIAAWFYFNGMLQDFIDLNLFYPATIYSGVTSLSFGNRIKGVVEFFFKGHVTTIILPSAILGYTILWRKSKVNAFLLLAWILTTIFVVMIQNKFFLYHWTIIYAPLTILSAIGFYSVFFKSLKVRDETTKFPYDVTRVFVIITFVVLLFHASMHPAFEVARWFGYITGATSQKSYYDNFGFPGDDILAAKYINENTSVNDHVLVWGWNTAIIYLSERQSPTRFGFSMPLIMGSGNATPKTLYRQEFMNNLHKKPPVYIVVAPLSEVILGGSYELSDFLVFEKFIATKYKEEIRFGDLILYHRLEI